MRAFSAKFYLPPAKAKNYSEIRAQKTPVATRDEDVQKVLAQLSEDSGTGPDLLPTRIVKRCSKELVKPVRMLTERISETGVWPAS